MATSICANTQGFFTDSIPDNKHSDFTSQAKTNQPASKLRKIADTTKLSLQRFGVFSAIQMRSAGFQYTGVGDTACCRQCGLEISNWTSEMKPFAVHSKRSPECPFILSISSYLASAFRASTNSSSATTAARDLSLTTSQENPNKRQKVESSDSESTLNSLFETDLVQQVRKRTFSHWPQRNIPSSAQMIEAGFFNCNVGDRVICIYCNLICQQWTPHTDDPCEVHKTLSPNCVFVKTKLMRPASSSIIIVNDDTMGAVIGSRSPTGNNLAPIRSNDIVFTAPCNPAYAEIPRRHASYTAWPTEDLPPVDDLVRAGFFYTGTKSIVTCFYCNGSLQNWGANDNPMIEHARWFPHCAYARQLCGDDLYRKIQESKRAQQERARANEGKERGESNPATNTSTGGNSRLLIISDDNTLSRLVAARLDLPISQRLLDQNFKLSIIKRCWEDQLRTKHDDFVSDCDLYIACLILQKQIENIDGKKENIAVPSIRMKRIREQNQNQSHEQTSATSAVTQMQSNASDIERTVSSQSSTTESTSSQSSMDSATKLAANASSERDTKTTKQATDQASNSSTRTTLSNPCILCLGEDKRLACIPCGHMATCVACGHSLRFCPICRREIEAFVRIFI